MTKRIREAGDTIVEVMFAIAVFSAVAVGGLGIMNKGIAISIQSLQLTLVRQEISNQAELLRYVHDGYVASLSTSEGGSHSDMYNIWNTISNQDLSVQPVIQSTGITCPNIPTGSFLLQTTGGHVSLLSRIVNNVPDKNSPMINEVKDVTHAQLNYFANGGPRGEGIYIQPFRTNPKNGYIDFYITACWGTPGQNYPATLGTIVRLYEQPK